MEGAFGIKLGLTKAQRLETGDSQMTHAMLLTAVHLDNQGESVRWRIENSWSDQAGPFKVRPLSRVDILLTARRATLS